MNLYRDEFNVISDHGCLNRVLRSLVVPIATLLLLQFLPVSRELSVLTFIALQLFLLYIADKYVRRLYPDWPTSGKFAGTIVFATEDIVTKRTDGQVQVRIQDISELILFWDHFRGYRLSFRDIARNGNALIYIKSNDGNVSAFKFNVESKIESDLLQLNFEHYKSKIIYCRSYKPESIPTILTPDLKSRKDYS